LFGASDSTLVFVLLLLHGKYFGNKYFYVFKELRRWFATPLQGNQEPLVRSKSVECDTFSFSVPTLLVGQQEGHLACKKFGVCFLVVPI